MSRKKNNTPTLSLREQTEIYLFQSIINFEQLSGIPISRVDVIHRKGMGFNSKDTIEVNIITQNDV